MCLLMACHKELQRLHQCMVMLWACSTCHQESPRQRLQYGARHVRQQYMLLTHDAVPVTCLAVLVQHHVDVLEAEILHGLYVQQMTILAN